MKFLAILVLALATASAYETPVPFRDVPFGAENESRIIDGKKAVDGDVPWQVGMSLNGMSWCGGSLIDEGVVLTAGHCVGSVFSATLYMGSVARTGGTKVSVSSSNIFRHDGYNANTIANDIAVIKLTTPIKFTKDIQAVKLPARTGSYSTYAGNTATISGWGKTSDSGSVASDLMIAQVKVITNDLCSRTYGTESVNSGTICASTDDGQSTCNGDSGGPMTIEGVQVGIVSYGSSAGCTKGYPVAFTRTSFFRDWIYKTSGV